MRDHDNRVKEAAQALLNNDTTKYKRLLSEIASGGFDQKLVSEAIKAEKNKIEKESSNDEKEETNDNEEKRSSIYDSEDLNRALETGESNAVQEIISDMLEVKTENAKQKLLDKGFNEKRADFEAKKDAESAIRSQLTRYWKPIYKKHRQKKKQKSEESYMLQGYTNH